MADRKVTSSIDLLKTKNKVLLAYHLRIEDESENKNIPFTININSEKYNNILTLNCKVEKAEIKLNMYMVGRIDENKIETKRKYTYKLEIKNVKNEDISNLSIKVVHNSAINLENAFIERDGDFQKIEVNDEFNVETLKKDNILIYYFDVQLNDNENISQISALVNNKYRSNEVDEELIKYTIEAELTSDNQGQEISKEEKVKYNLSIKNTGNININRVDITQSISKYLDVKSVTINNEDVQFKISYEYKDVDKMVEDDEEETTKDIDSTEFDNYIIEYSYNKELKVNEKIDVLIETQINEEDLLDNRVKIESEAKVLAQVSNKTEKVQHTKTPIDINSLDL